jgi:hypothetical protein
LCWLLLSHFLWETNGAVLDHFKNRDVNVRVLARSEKAKAAE